jgi:putative peptidoglycan lipid II flippase
VLISRTLARLRHPLIHGGLVVGAGILLGNITGFFRVAVTAWLLGTHARADTLAVAMGPLDTMNQVGVNTMLFAFVPTLMLAGSGARTAIFARSRRIFLAIFAAAAVAMTIFAPAFTSLVGPGLQASQRAEVATLLRLFAPSLFFAGASGVYSALLYTERRFLVPALYQTCLNGSTIVGALALREAIGINGFAIGYSAGAALQLLLTWRASRDLDRPAQVREVSGISSISLAHVLRTPGMFLVYAGLIAANVIATRAYATHAGSGMAAAFDYCIRCISVINAYLVYPVATTLVPEIARLRGTGKSAQARRLIDRGLALMAIAAAVSCAIGILLRTPIIALLFQRGNFTVESTHLVAAVFLGFAPSILGWALLDLMARCLFALDEPWLPMAAAAVPIVVNLAITSVLRADGRLANPAWLGAGASVGLIAGFATLFLLIHARREAAQPEPALVEAG